MEVPTRRRLSFPNPLVLVLALLPALAVLATPGPAAAQSPCGDYYTVREGDSLLGIAETCGITLPALLAANEGVKDEMDMNVGDKLHVPPRGEPQPTPQQACGAYYHVRTGDTLAEIAEKCGLTVPLLVAANGPLPDPLGIHTGATVRIPDLPEGMADDTTVLAVAPAAGEARATARGQGQPGAPEGAPAAAPDLVRVAGVLEAGEPCSAVRTADGRMLHLVGDISDAFHPGEQVVVMGVPTTPDRCGGQRALEVRILYHPRPPR